MVAPVAWLLRPLVGMLAGFVREAVVPLAMLAGVIILAYGLGYDPLGYVWESWIWPWVESQIYDRLGL